MQAFLHLLDAEFSGLSRDVTEENLQARSRGRAGGGEEMGGVRGVKHYMQRTALQGSPQTLTAIGNRWTRGADENDPGVHPFRKTFEQLLSYPDQTLFDLLLGEAVSSDTLISNMIQDIRSTSF